MATPEDLAETVQEVEALDRRIVAAEADVRDEAGLRAAFEAGRGRSSARSTSCWPTRASRRWRGRGGSPAAWQDVIDVNLTGVFNTVEVAIPP